MSEECRNRFHAVHDIQYHFVLVTSEVPIPVFEVSDDCSALAETIDFQSFLKSTCFSW